MDIKHTKIGITVTSWQVILKTCTIKEELNKKNLSELLKYCFWLLVANHFAFRAEIHFGQVYSDNHKKYLFINSIENSFKNNDFEFTKIANMDETSLFLNMAKTKVIV